MFANLLEILLKDKTEMSHLHSYSGPLWHLEFSSEMGHRNTEQLLIDYTLSPFLSLLLSQPTFTPKTAYRFDCACLHVNG